jgi:hypothetical protein
VIEEIEWEWEKGRDEATLVSINAYLNIAIHVNGSEIEDQEE